MKRRRIEDRRSETGREHEEGLLRFIDPQHRARFREVLKSVAAGRPAGSLAGGGRYRLSHFDGWDYRYAVDVKGFTSDQVEAELRASGASDTCWVISEDSEIDAKELPIGKALARMWDPWEATIASCIPGELAYYHDNDENEYLILERPPG